MSGWEKAATRMSCKHPAKRMEMADGACTQNKLYRAATRPLNRLFSLLFAERFATQSALNKQVPAGYPGSFRGKTRVWTLKLWGSYHQRERVDSSTETDFVLLWTLTNRT